ncbi:MAG: AAA family ATPase, partial [Polaromonas sp.]|nr:AAA family ATPase [Polaromonas sp.]
MLASNTARRVSQDAKNQMTGPKVSISGQIAKVFYTGDRSGKSLLLIKARDGAVFKVEGPLPVPPLMGMRIQTEAYAVEHPKYGTQYKADLITEEVPIDRPGAVAFMAKTLAGVGKVLASKLFDAFGERVYETIQNHPQELLKVPGMTQEKLGPLLESWKEHANTRMLWTYLAKYEIGGGTAAKIYAKFGAQAATVAMHRPYQLTAVDGVGFATVDRIALSSGVRADSVGRVIAALRFALDANKKRGSTSCPRDALINQATRLLAVESEGSVSGPAPSREAISKAIDECVEREALKIVQVRGVACVVTPAMQQLESLLADHVLRIAKPVAPENAEPDKPVLDPAILVARAHAAAEHLGDAAQIEAVALPFKHAFTVITGGPGCGKTTVTKQITKVAEEAGLRVVMMAPTGKAARRMAEVTGKPVDTIHSTLQPESGEFNSFKRNEHNPLEGDLFIADESTMADAYVALALLRAIPTGAKVLFVGDVDQLPSVGPGAVMRDLIQSETVPVARLSTPHRTALNSDIVVNAHRIISGNAESVQTDGRRDFTVLNLADEEAHQAILVRYQEMANAYGKDGVQVLAPTYDGPVGVTALNAALQARVNPPSMERPEIEHHGVVFRLGDRVM